MRKAMESIKVFAMCLACAIMIVAILVVGAIWFIAQIGLMKMGLAELGIAIPLL